MTCVAAFLDQAFDFLRPGTSGDQQRVGHVDNNKIVYTEAGNQATRPRNDDTASNLLGDN